MKIPVPYFGQKIWLLFTDFSDPVLDSGPKHLFRFRIGSGLKFRILSDPVSDTQHCLKMPVITEINTNNYGSGKLQNFWVLRIRIRNTGRKMFRIHLCSRLRSSKKRQDTAQKTMKCSQTPYLRITLLQGFAVVVLIFQVHIRLCKVHSTSYRAKILIPKITAKIGLIDINVCNEMHS
jgi:hypothetical protein